MARTRALRQSGAVRILAVKWRGLGDTVLWTSALQALRDHFPSAKIDLAFPSSFAALFEADPRFDRRFLLERSLAATARLGTLWRDRRYDWFLGFHASGRLVPLAVLSGARKRVLHHHSRRPRSFFSHVSIPRLGQGAAATERDTNVARALGWVGGAPAPRLFVDPRSRLEGRARLRDWQDESRPLVVLGPESTRPAKQWPWERFDEVARALLPSCRVALVAQSPEALPGWFVGRWGRHLLATPSLRDLLSVLSVTDCYVSGDSGAKHVACALGVATVTVFGPESVGEWHPYSLDRHPVLRVPAACRDNDPSPTAFAWCGAHSCPISSHHCLTTIPAGAVLAEVWRVLGMGAGDRAALLPDTKMLPNRHPAPL